MTVLTVGRTASFRGKQPEYDDLIATLKLVHPDLMEVHPPSFCYPTQDRAWDSDLDSQSVIDKEGARIPLIYLQHLVPLLAEAKEPVVDMMDLEAFQAADVYGDYLATLHSSLKPPVWYFWAEVIRHRFVPPD